MVVWKGSGRNESWTNLRYCPDYLERLKNDRKKPLNNWDDIYILTHGHEKREYYLNRKI
jgi:hypothetical protein